jgi:hypothetical protein
MSMSVDGYIAGPDDEPGNPGGDGFLQPGRSITTRVINTVFRSSCSVTGRPISRLQATQLWPT